jgi:hypothetical protein
MQKFRESDRGEDTHSVVLASSGANPGLDAATQEQLRQVPISEYGSRSLLRSIIPAAQTGVGLGEAMTCWPVSQRVGNVKNNDPSLIAFTPSARV